MIIPSSDVRKAVKAVWPKQRFTVLSDTEWLKPDVDEIDAMIHEVAVDRMTYMAPLFECEEFALSLVVAVRGRRADLAKVGKLERERWRNWPLGVVCGTRFRGVEEYHWINICLTQQGLRLIEPQTGEMWAPVVGEDEIFILFM